MKNANCSVRIYEDTYNKLKKIKEETGITMAFMIDKALNEYFKKIERKEK